MGKYWNEEIECMAHEDMKKLQSERLVKQVKHVWDNVPYYKTVSYTHLTLPTTPYV